MPDYYLAWCCFQMQALCFVIIETANNSNKCTNCQRTQPTTQQLTCVHVFIIHMVSKPRTNILYFKIHCPSCVSKFSNLWQFLLKRCLSGSEFKMCLHTFQSPSLGTASVGKTALSLQSTKLYCFRGILCHSVSHGLIINIYAFSKWICCANKHCCLVLFFNIS